MVQSKISSFSQEFLVLLKSMSFYRALLVCIAVALPISIGALTDQVEIGLAIGFGAFWCSPSDVSGSAKHMRNGILFSALLITLITFIANFFSQNIWILTPVFGVLLFLTSLISIFGFRGSLISFAGLLALVLSFAFNSGNIHPVVYSLLIGAGGLWYLALATIWYRLNPRASTEEALSEVFKLTAKYIKTRSKLIHPDADRILLQDELFQYQEELGELHETLREILLSERRSSGRSSYRRKRVLVFIQLIKILEQAMANPVNYEKMDDLLRNQAAPIKAFQQLMDTMCQKLHLLADSKRFKDVEADACLQEHLEEIQKEIVAYAYSSESDAEVVLILKNLYRYQVKQVDAIEKIFWIMHGGSTRNMEDLSASNAAKFITPQVYSLQIVKDNLSFQSIIFRHSLRLAVVGMFGLVIGELLEIHNAYWILLTVVVILRPNYGLTKTRAKERTIGTLIGGVVAFGVIFLVHSVVVYAILGVLSFLIAFTMIQTNYRAGAVFITLNIVFIYALLEPDLWNVIQFRVIDTAIGAGLATLGNMLLWPAWEVKNIRGVVATSVEANRKFLAEIVSLYESKSSRPNSYNLARKEAFLSVSNLSATFQRMTQEPKSQQKNMDVVYELVTLNHTFLSALASTSTFIQNHPTTEASTSFSLAAKNIDNNLDNCISLLKYNRVFEDKDADNQLSWFLVNVETKTLLEMEETPEELAENDVDRNVNEAYIIIEQLKWLYSLSNQMQHTIQKLESIN
ncbi:MAG TPA: FUSC family membrane protein [Flavobacteriaceae bacterium]|nr:FUSC family membrane protein [Flavobacteriaceae bacterium]